VREKHKQIYIGSSHRPKVVQSPCTSRGFHYNLTRLQLLKHTDKRLLNAQVSQNKRLLKLTNLWKNDITHLIYYQRCFQNTMQYTKTQILIQRYKIENRMNDWFFLSVRISEPLHNGTIVIFFQWDLLFIENHLEMTVAEG
jgi:hypothetical protein